MANLPLLIFPQVHSIPPPRGRGFGSRPQLPNFNHQKTRLEPKFRQLRESYIELTDDTSGLSPEQVIVIEIAGTVEDFIQATRRIDGMEWLAEYDIENISPHEGFSKLNSKNEPVDTPFDGRIFVTMTNQRAMNELLALWEHWDSDNKEFPLNFTKWRYIFEQTLDIRKWDIQDRLADTGVVDYWRDEVEIKRGTNSFIRSDIELWFRTNPEERNNAENRVRQLIAQNEGVIIGSACTIEEINFHSIKCDLRPETIEDVLNGNYNSLFKDGDIQHFRPTGQCAIQLGDGEDAPSEPPTSTTEGEPVVALLDGAPMLRHAWLDGRIIFDDPDDFASNYQANQFRHGTAMSSLICHGELDANELPLTRPIYVRPIMKPNMFSGIENIPDDNFPEDLIYRAVKRIKEGENNEPALSPNVLIINLSICDPKRPFFREMSPWARLLDWLSWKYHILFLVSTGNQTHDISIGLNQNDFDNLGAQDKSKLTTTRIHQDQRNHKILSPSESINSLSIGSLHKDESPPSNLGNRVDLQPVIEMPSPISSLGPGHTRTVKPEILLPGGRQLYNYLHDGEESNYTISNDPSAPGQRVASPAFSAAPHSLTNTTYIRGTSNATALATRGAARIYETLLELMQDDANTQLTADYLTPLIKTLLVHGARWDETGAFLKDTLSNNQNSRRIRRVVSQHIGYGAPDINHVLECTEQRVTVLGCSSIQADQVQEFRFSLPPCLKGNRIKRRLTLTLAWITPINPLHRKFRRAKLFINTPSGNTHLPVTRINSDHHQVKNGTIQHEVLEGDEVAEFVDGDYLSIKVTCKEDAGVLESIINYGIAVTLEVAEGSELPIYQEISERIRPAPQVRPR